MRGAGAGKGRWARAFGRRKRTGCCRGCPALARRAVAMRIGLAFDHIQGVKGFPAAGGFCPLVSPLLILSCKSLRTLTLSDYVLRFQHSARINPLKRPSGVGVRVIFLEKKMQTSG